MTHSHEHRADIFTRPGEQDPEHPGAAQEPPRASAASAAPQSSRLSPAPAEGPNPRLGPSAAHRRHPASSQPRIAPSTAPREPRARRRLHSGDSTPPAPLPARGPAPPHPQRPKMAAKESRAPLPAGKCAARTRAGRPSCRSEQHRVRKAPPVPCPVSSVLCPLSRARVPRGRSPQERSREGRPQLRCAGTRRAAPRGPRAWWLPWRRAAHPGEGGSGTGTGTGGGKNEGRSR